MREMMTHGMSLAFLGLGLVGCDPQALDVHSNSTAEGLQAPASSAATPASPASPTWDSSQPDNPFTPVSPTEPVTGSGGEAVSTSTMRFGRQVGGEVFGWWASNPFQTSDGRLWIGVQAYAPEGIDSVRFRVSGLGATTIVTPNFHADRRLKAYWMSLRASDVQADSVSVTAIVIPTGSHEPLESFGLTVEKRGTAWDAESYENGWTRLIPSPDSRLIYVAKNGNDAAASNVHGRGYYLPDDPEIGDDPTNPVGPIVAYQSMLEASKMFRGRNYTGDRADGFPAYASNTTPDRNGFPDWLLFRRGHSFTAPNFANGQLRSPPELVGLWNQASGGISAIAGGASGRSVSEPAVISAWGPPSEPRPTFDVFRVNGNSRNMAFVSVETAGEFLWSHSGDGNTADNVLVEDVRARSLGAANTTNIKNARFRRCVASGNFNGTSHNQGFFLGGSDTVTIEECVFDRNGYKENPDDATTWTGGAVVLQSGLNAVPAGQGIQPRRTYFDRNIYLSSYDSIALRGNIFSRNGGASSVQMGRGGLCERNLFIWNAQALLTTRGNNPPATILDGIIKENVILHDDHLLPPGGWGTGIELTGAIETTHVSDSNIIAHFHRTNNGHASIDASGKGEANGFEPSPLSRAVIANNAIYHEFGVVGIRVQTSTSVSGVVSADIANNAVSTPHAASVHGDSSRPTGVTYGGNRFHAMSGSGLFKAAAADLTFQAWQATGFDSDATFTNDFAAFKAAVGWLAPERDILSYMQAVDPMYVVNEDVYVDEESTVKQATRQRVWEVLADPAMYPADVWWHERALLSEARAKQVARRYHAFITFIQRAKKNRKGSWDPRWTAEAVNNYIREGFGKN